MEKEVEIFKTYLPENSVNYCYNLWLKYKFEFKITKPRLSKYGDYKYNFATQKHTITINGNQNKYAFLITYLHEVAHLINYNTYKNSVLPHGKEWKLIFSQLLQPVLNKSIFPLGVLIELESYAQNPKASSCSDHDLIISLNKHNTANNGKCLLDELKIGDKFILNNKTFIKGITKRTRTLCADIKTKKQYLVSNIAEVILFEG